MKPDEKDPVAARLFGGLEPPEPPLKLRSRTLAAARERLAGEASLDVWSRIWNHGGLRLAWAASVAVLLAGHLLATLSPGGPTASVEEGLIAKNGVDENFVDLLRPVRISENAQPMVGLITGANSPIELDLEGNSS